jgi:hypothetical protein
MNADDLAKWEETKRQSLALEKKLQAEAAERRKTPFVYRGLDLRAEARTYCRALKIKLPEIRIRHGVDSGISGCAWRHRIVLTIGSKTTRSRVMEALLHELVHVAAYKHNHDEVFCALLVRTARELWGVEVTGWLTLPREHRSNRAYAIDDLIVRELTAKLAAGEVQPSMAITSEPAPVVSLTEQRSKLVQRREERARKALAKAEAEMRRVQKRLSKWKTKVRYYEKRAAASASRGPTGV